MRRSSRNSALGEAGFGATERERPAEHPRASSPIRCNLGIASCCRSIRDGTNTVALPRKSNPFPQLLLTIEDRLPRDHLIICQNHHDIALGTYNFQHGVVQGCIHHWDKGQPAGAAVRLWWACYTWMTSMRGRTTDLQNYIRLLGFCLEGDFGNRPGCLLLLTASRPYKFADMVILLPC